MQAYVICTEQNNDHMEIMNIMQLYIAYSLIITHMPWVDNLSLAEESKNKT